MARRFVAVLVAALIGTIGVALASPAGAAGAIIVNPGQSIQAAVDAASPGTTIIVQHGTYAENVAITKDGIRLIGVGATLVPPATSEPNACSLADPSGPGPAHDGFCGAGNIEFPPDGPPVVTDPLTNVTISGFTVTGFEGVGVIFIGAENPTVMNVHAVDNGEYGIARFVSTGGKIVANVAEGSEEAGIYVGDSPDANVLIASNEVSGNLFGFFLRDAANGKVVGNRSHDNCVGLINLNTGSNVAGEFNISGNLFPHNNEFCEGSEEEGTPPLSGIGVLIAGGHGNSVKGNIITDNVPSAEVPFSGGVVVVDAGAPGANPPSDNVVKGNVIKRNQPDIFFDGSGSGNVFEANACDTSVPDGLC
jgi:parallel beta-helix repeat protein